jgi:1,4-dihydroxy-2-naphthoate octaprenyltransferase
MRSTGAIRSTARRNRLELVTTLAAFTVCLVVAVFLALVGSPLLLFVASVCTAVALFEVAVSLMRFRP